MIEGSTFMTIYEFAEELSVKHQHIRKWIREGKIKSMKLGDGPRAKIRIPRTELQRLHAEAYE